MSVINQSEKNKEGEEKNKATRKGRSKITFSNNNL